MRRCRGTWKQVRDCCKAVGCWQSDYRYLLHCFPRLTDATDMLAGPSECLVVVDKTSNPKIVAADLIAQAEHDPDARPIIVNVVYNTESGIFPKREIFNEPLTKKISSTQLKRRFLNNLRSSQRQTLLDKHCLRTDLL